MLSRVAGDGAVRTPGRGTLPLPTERVDHVRRLARPRSRRRDAVQVDNVQNLQ